MLELYKTIKMWGHLLIFDSFPEESLFLSENWATQSFCNTSLLEIATFV